MLSFYRTPPARTSVIWSISQVAEEVVLTACGDPPSILSHNCFAMNIGDNFLRVLQWAQSDDYEDWHSRTEYARLLLNSKDLIASKIDYSAVGGTPEMLLISLKWIGRGERI
jgi:hypothetical protein